MSEPTKFRKRPVVIDLDDVDDFIADYIIERADPRAEVEEAPR